MSKFYVLLLVLSSAVSLLAQEVKPAIAASAFAGSAKKSAPVRAPRAARISTPDNNRAFIPLLHPVLPHHNSENDELLQAWKKGQAVLKKTAALLPEAEPVALSAASAAGVDMVITASFPGNTSNGCPPDNTVAVSNAGWIVSLVNSNIFMFNRSGTVLKSFTLYDFYKRYSPDVSSRLCDPKILYDVSADRFIFYAQICDGVPANSKVIISFSTSNDPTGDWNMYSLTGNPLNNNSWFDYPKIGISKNELYVTGNLYSASGQYRQSVVYQIPKAAGYQGRTLNWQYWHNIPGAPFTLLPLTYGQTGSYVPGVYLVASVSGGSSSLKFYDLTDDMSASNEELKYYSLSTAAYAPPTNAAQKGSPNYLDTGDCRMQDGFYLNGVAHFVFSVGEDNWGAIRYYRLKVDDFSSLRYFTIHHSGVKDYAYPAVASYSTSTSDQSAIVVFTASSG
jgi:hypothetical protein